jgi:predicted protein tyrosine phosphatase
MVDNYSMPRANRNQLANVTNPYQGKSKKALCVCSAGLLRSPTIAKLLTQLGYNTRACGTSQEYALVPISEALLVWADEIYVVSEQVVVVRKLLEALNLLGVTPVTELDIPDEYGTFDPELELIIMDMLNKEGK